MADDTDVVCSSAARLERWVRSAGRAPGSASGRV